jgi:uncharacterized protein (TIGR03382 family)
MNRINTTLATCAVAAAALLTPAALAGGLGPGIYVLNNHPDGNAQPPQYGLRLDELVNVTPGHDIFTFDFNHPSSLVVMTLSASTIRIQGHAFGGRDTGGSYANDVHRGVYSFDFLYNLGVQGVPGDDDIWVNTTNHANFGWIQSPSGVTHSMVDERGSFAYSFRLGDENNDLGHRNFPGVSGWGWLSMVVDGQIVHTESQDWLFTVGNQIPTPGAAALLGLGGLLAARRRRA